MLKGNTVYTANVTLTDGEEFTNYFLGVYENKNTIKEQLKQDKDFLEICQICWDKYFCNEGYKDYEEYFNEVLDCIEIIEQVIN